MNQTNQKPTNPANEVPAVPEKANLKTGSGVMAIVPVDLDGAWRLANVIGDAGMAPKSYGTDANKIMVGIMHGMEVGFTPMAALQSIAVINGMPSIFGDGALALVRASGLMEDFEEAIEGEGDARTATCTIKRADQQTPIVRSFSMTDAVKAKLKNKSGPWQDYPDRMLQMRARSWALRDGFADVLKGLHIREEVEDMKVVGSSEPTSERPNPSDYQNEETPDEKSSQEQEAVIMLHLVDEFGESHNLGEFSTAEFVETVVKKLEGFDAREPLDAFWEHNAEAIESLGAKNPDRQEVSQAYNDARDRLDDAPESKEPIPIEEWEIMWDQFDEAVQLAPSIDDLERYLAEKQKILADMSAQQPTLHASLFKIIEAKRKSFDGQT